MRLEDFYACLGGILSEELIRELRNQWAHSQKAPHELIHEWAAGLGDPQVLREVLYALGTHRGSQESQFHTPEGVSTLIAKLAETDARNSILDPICGHGLLLSAVAEVTKPSVLHGIEINEQAAKIANALLGPTASITCGDALAPHTNLLERYDFICADAPLGVTLRPDQQIFGLQGKRCRDLGHGLTVWAAERLSEKGLAVINVTPSFFFSVQSESIYSALAALGCRIRAVIHLPAGTLSYTGIETYLVVIERGKQREMFVGQYNEDADHQANLVRNFKRGKAGPQPALGRLCALEGFRGFDAFVAQGRLSRLARKAGWPGYSGSELITAHQRFSSGRDNSLVSGVNSVFLRSAGRVLATTQLDELIDGKESRKRFVVHLHVNTDLVEPRYLAHWFNDSQMGQATLSSISRGSVMTQISSRDLYELTYYLPPLSEQRQVLNAVGDLQRIRAEAYELESRLWTGTDPVEELAYEISTINQEDRYEDWIESLPFPLASILWRHHASQVSYRERYEILLHFFEATAAFIATIHLSAFMQSDDLWSEHGSKLTEKLSKQRLSLQRATFGSWKLVVEYLSSVSGKLLSDSEHESLVKRLYGTPNTKFLEHISAGKLRSVLQHANKVRNDWSGHAGAIGAAKAEQIHFELMELVQQLRGLFGRSWLDFELIQPGDARYKDGLHHVKAKRIMGTRSAPFESVVRVSNDPLEADSLYLFDAMGQTGIRLKPFVQVIPSPERQATACFIFSRREGAGSRFVSYHFEKESEIEGPFPGVELAFEMINSVRGKGK